MAEPATHLPPAVVLLSGGLDSTTVLAIAKSSGFHLHAMTFRYGQRHDMEVRAAEKIARLYEVTNHVVVDIDLGTFGGSALTSDELPVPKSDTVDDIGEGIPVTYVPARNTIFLSFALAMAEVVGSADIFIGVNALDYSGYPDCRPAFIQAFQEMANQGTKAGVEGRPYRIQTPLIDLTKAQIIARGLELGVDYGLTTSCYDPASSGLACGKCDACLLRLRGFAQNETPDPIGYVATGGLS